MFRWKHFGLLSFLLVIQLRHTLSTAIVRRELRQARSGYSTFSEEEFLGAGGPRAVNCLGSERQKKSTVNPSSDEQGGAVLIIRLRSKSEWRFGSAYASLFANRTRTLRCLSSRSCRRNVIALHEHAHKRDRQRAGRRRDVYFAISGKKTASTGGPACGREMRRRGGSLPPVGLTSSHTDNGRLPSVTFLREATGNGRFRCRLRSVTTRLSVRCWRPHSP
jgi:hypothetical protein